MISIDLWLAKLYLWASDLFSGAAKHHIDQQELKTKMLRRYYEEKERQKDNKK